MTSETAWLIARAGGLVAYGLLTLTVVLGILHSGRRLRSLPRFAVEDVHRFLSILTAIFLGLHGVGLLLDTVVPISPAELLVPFRTSVSPVWTGLGVIAAELLVALALTNRLRPHLSHRVWRTLHGLAFPVWGLATVHGLLAGTDSDQWWAIATYATASAATVGLLTWRLTGARADDVGVQNGALAGVAAAAVAVALAIVPLGDGGGAGTGNAAADVQATVTASKG